MPVLRVSDTRSYPKYWRRIVLFLGHHPNRRFSTEHIAEHIYADDPDGGPESAVTNVRVWTYLHRDKVPDGWEVVRPKTHGGQGYALRPVLEGKP